jgi:peptidoglycan/xylan/chitin deacetylase (PgdA/CDA1 family)
LSDVLVLCYHAVSPTWPSVLSVTPDLFERQLEVLVRRGYRGSTFEEAVHRPPHAKTLAVTFDDAYRSVITHAAPILDRLGLVGTIYVPTAWPGREEPMAWHGIDDWLDTPHRDELVCASWDELRDVAARGWEIASHTRTHPELPEIADDGALADELAVSRSVVEERIEAPCRTIAYPYGFQDGRVRAAAAQAGYTAGAALSRVYRTGDPMAYPRVGLYPRDEGLRYRAKVSRIVRRLRSRPGPADHLGR